MRRGKLPRDVWWLLLILGLSVGPLIASAFLAVGVAALASAAGLVPGVGPDAPVPVPDSPPAPPAPPPGGRIQFRITVEGDGEVYVSPPGGSCSAGQTCMVEYNLGDQIGLGAVAGLNPGSNASFAGWGGDCASLGREQYPLLVMDDSKDCIAYFTPP
jgi:hypothetical protein